MCIYIILRIENNVIFYLSYFINVLTLASPNIRVVLILYKNFAQIILQLCTSIICNKEARKIFLDTFHRGFIFDCCDLKPFVELCYYLSN